MEIKVTRVTGWQRAVNAARWTVNKEALTITKQPSDKVIRNLIRAEHSPIRLVEFDIKIKGIPYCNAVHFVRHHIGMEKFQCTLRDDRNKDIDDRRKLPQDYPVNLWMCCNVQALINISRKRLCHKASRETRKIWEMVKDKIEEIDPNVAEYMVRECIYRGFCPEQPSCGYAQTENFEPTLWFYQVQ